MSFSRQQNPGIGYVPAYEISGVPYVTSSVAAEVQSGSAVRVSFPFVTRWVEIVNTGVDELRIGFSANGVLSKGAAVMASSGAREEAVSDIHRNGRRNYFMLAASGSAGHAQGRARWELRCTDMFFSTVGDSGTSFSVVAGLTSIKGPLVLTGSKGFIGIG